MLGYANWTRLATWSGKHDYRPEERGGCPAEKGARFRDASQPADNLAWPGGSPIPMSGFFHDWTRLDRYSTGAHGHFPRGRTKHRASDNCRNCRIRPGRRLCWILFLYDRRTDQACQEDL